jgi:hypothetical protein
MTIVLSDKMHSMVLRTVSHSHINSLGFKTLYSAHCELNNYWSSDLTHFRGLVEASLTKKITMAS